MMLYHLRVILASAAGVSKSSFLRDMFGLKGIIYLLGLFSVVHGLSQCNVDDAYLFWTCATAHRTKACFDSSSSILFLQMSIE